MASDGADTGRCLPYPSSSMPNTFAFKIQDRKGRMHRFNCGTFLSCQMEANHGHYNLDDVSCLVHKTLL